MSFDLVDIINVSIFEEIIEASIIEETLIIDVVEETFAINISEEILNINIVEEVINVNINESQDINISVESWSCPQIIETGGSGFIFITNVINQGASGEKAYKPDTVPVNSVLESITVEHENCEIFFIAEGGKDYSPIISINEVQCLNLQEIGQDKRLFQGSIPISILTSQNVIVRSSTGQNTVVTINRANTAPNILTCIIGSYPNQQTAAKQNDIIHVSGTVELSATFVKLHNFEAFTDSGWVECNNGVFDILGVVSNENGLLGAKVTAKDKLGSISKEFISGNQITLDQNKPSFIDLGIEFPQNQEAFKGNEIGFQNTIVNDCTSINYNSSNNDFIVQDITVYQEQKKIQCTNPNYYNDSTVNFSITAYKSTNDTYTSFNKVIEIADVQPVVVISQQTIRLQSSEIGKIHTIHADCNQHLLEPPNINIPISGIWVGTSFQGITKAFTRQIIIKDNDSKGIALWAFETNPPQNRAGIYATISGNQNVGGFVARQIKLPAFGTSVIIPVEVTQIFKLIVDWSFKKGMTFAPVGMLPPAVQRFTVNNVGVNPTTLIILDLQATSANSQESIITIEETI